ncbi:hypothetical protein MTR_8g054490 [Medicago truncatula]|uniref:Reverse transcriptase domain-containing protein n=1 Tax=Medicago truncatula TaxID=3880 RepID=A0A072TQD1_MEDTR|nr:hypothetical protein MTR_8g054490 [Medicago truncatula]
MPPRKNDQTLRDIQMEEMKRQIQQLQETVNAQQAQLEAQHMQSYVDESSSESSSLRSRRPQRQSFRDNDIKVNIPNFEGKLHPDEFVDWLQTVERVFEYKEILEEKKFWRKRRKVKRREENQERLPISILIKGDHRVMVRVMFGEYWIENGVEKIFPKAKLQLNCNFAVNVQNAFLLSQFDKFKFRTGFRCLRKSCRYGCYLSLGFGGTRFKHKELKI